MSDTQGWKPKHMATGEKRPAPSAPSAARSASTDAKATESTENQVGRNAALMSFLVIVSRITGFFRTWGQSFALGAGMVASCYSVANNLPNQLYEIVVGGMLVTAFLPVYMSVKQREGEKGASRYTSNLVSIVTLLMGAVAVLGFIFAAQLVWTQSFSATSDFDADFATYLFRFFVVEVVLYSLSSIFSGVLNAERDYFWSSASSIFNNFVITASFLLYAALVNVNPTLATLILAIGNPAGVAVQVLVRCRRCASTASALRGTSTGDPALRDTLSIGIPSLVVAISRLSPRRCSRARRFPSRFPAHPSSTTHACGIRCPTLFSPCPSPRPCSPSSPTALRTMTSTASSAALPLA